MSTRLWAAVRGFSVAALLSFPLLGVALGDEADPPGRAARLSYAQGSVSLQPAGMQDWAAAVVNRPLTTGDKLWTDQDARAELDIGNAVIRLGPSTGFSFLNLDDNTAQMRVTAGTAIVHVRELLNGQTYEIDTPNLALSLERAGDYRVEVNDAGDTTVVKVSDGEALATGPADYSVPVRNQQAITFTGTDQLSEDVAQLGAPDSLDDWSMQRERQAEQSQSRRYVADDMAGWQDLDSNGEWEYTPDYGYVWAPTVVAPDWAPYRFGHWVWISPWGWTWVDNAPWGYAPFHYGRWVYRDRWCWVPGPRHVRPIYAPALVAWVGGPSFGVSVGVGGGVGWFPLGPREVYVPGYHVSQTYITNINVTNTTVTNTYVTNIYKNRGVNNIRYVNRTAPGAVTAVPQNVFTSAQPVAGHRMHIPESAIARIAPSAAPPAIAPVRQSVLGAGSPRNFGLPPANVLNRPVVARTPPPAAPAPFDRQVAAIRANGGRPLPSEQIARLRPTTPVAPVRLVNPAQQPGRPFGLPDRSLADREHSLQNNGVPTQGMRTDRPGSAQQSASGGPPNIGGTQPNGGVQPNAGGRQPNGGGIPGSVRGNVVEDGAAGNQHFPRTFPVNPNGNPPSGPVGQLPRGDRTMRDDRPPSGQQQGSPAPSAEGRMQIPERRMQVPETASPPGQINRLDPTRPQANPNPQPRMNPYVRPQADSRPQIESRPPVQPPPQVESRPQVEQRPQFESRPFGLPRSNPTPAPTPAPAPAPAPRAIPQPAPAPAPAPRAVAPPAPAPAPAPRAAPPPQHPSGNPIQQMVPRASPPQARSEHSGHQRDDRR